MSQRTLVIIILLALFAAGAAYFYSHRAPRSPIVSPADVVSSAESDAIRALVSAFGGAMKEVSLSDPNREASMRAAYGAYVAPELLAQWATGSDAPGRSVSSPWPERINIVDIVHTGGNYVVHGNVIEAASTPSATSAPVAVYPLTLTLEKRGESWMIVAAEKGAYSELPHEQAVIGLWECLPHIQKSGPQTTECAFGIAIERSDGHMAVDTSRLSDKPVDYPIGTKVRVTGIVTPANQLSSPQKYDIDAIISATRIEIIR